MAFLLVQTLPQNNSSRTLQTIITALEVALLSAGLFSTFVIIKGALLPTDAVFSTLSGFWNSVVCLFSSPLCICIIINFIVVLIAVSSSSNFRHHKNDEILSAFNVDDDVQILESFVVTQPPSLPPREVYEVISTPPLDTLSLPSPFLDEVHVSESLEIKKLQDLSSSSSDPFFKKELIMVTPNDDKEDNNHREEMITMEATWKAITGEGGERPQKKHFEKSKTWDPHVPSTAAAVVPSTSSASPPKRKELRKAETFNDEVSMRRRGGLIRRDPSMTLEEFNNQVEAFIKTFNDDMRLQRQQSEQRYFLEMINRGAA